MAHMAIGWGTRRKMLYSSVAIVIIGVALIISYIVFFNKPPTCFDHIQDGNETGVDCGGSCALLCPDQAYQPTVLWSRAFPVSSTTYTAAAYVQNTNAGAGARGVHYLFQLFDNNNNLVIEETGITDLPPVQTIPIVVPGIYVGQRSVSRVLFSFTDTPVWNKVPADTLPSLSISNETLAPNGMQLSATITNNSFQDVTNITAVAVLFDSNNTAIAASKSLIQHLAQQSAQTIVFTWPQNLSAVSRAEITLLPSF